VGQTFPILMSVLDLSQGSIVSLVSVVTAGVMLDHGLGLATSLELDRACLSDGPTGF
jgi:ribose/xylose/arabinose/galactoside ABC-type transport system permease subunit